MSTRCELSLNVFLGGYFRDRIVSFFRQEGFEKVLELTLPKAPDVLEFRRGDELVSISFDEGRADRVEVTLESEWPAADALFVDAIRWIAGDLLTSLIHGLPGCESETLDEQVSACLDELLRRVSVCRA